MGQLLYTTLNGVISKVLLRPLWRQRVRAQRSGYTVPAAWVPGALRAPVRALGGPCADGARLAGNFPSKGALGRAPQARTESALRVWRLAESNQRADCAGRMVISGRMADVCAALERMALHEQTAPASLKAQ